MDQPTIQQITTAAADVKAVLDALKSAGVASPLLDAADAAAGAVQQATAGGAFDPKPLVGPILAVKVAELRAVQAAVSDPAAKAVLGFLADSLGKLQAA